jgi:uncharacterized protein YrrD
MKKIFDIVGLSVISINKGVSVGRIKDVIINAKNGTVDFIVLESDYHNTSTCVISSKEVVGLGEYAMTIMDENSISNIEEVPSALDLLHRSVKVSNTKVLTKKGRLIGEIGGIYIDEDSNDLTISGLEFLQDIAKKSVKIIPRDSILTFGKELIVVVEDVENKLINNIDELENVSNKENIIIKKAENIKEFVEEESKKVATGHNSFKDSVKILKSDKDDFENHSIASDIDNKKSGKSKVIKNTESSITGLFEEKQREFLLGRTVSKNITDKNGNVLISQGTQIDNEVIDRVKNSGKLVELVMNNKV